MTEEEIIRRIEKDLDKVSCVSIVEYVNAVYYSLDSLKNEDPNCFSNYDVSVLKPSSDEAILREIHEELCDEIRLEVVINRWGKIVQLQIECQQF